MADIPPKFPWRRPKIKSTNDSSKSKENIFLQSVSNELVKEIFTNAKCVCGNPFSGNPKKVPNFPMFAHCGHFKHYRCMQIPVSQQRNQKCSDKCPKEEPEPFALDAKNLLGFLIAINKPGHKCIGCPKDSNIHPWTNVIRILKVVGVKHICGIYICVWCAADKKEYDKCAVKFIAKDHYIPRRDGPPPVNSLDRTVLIDINTISSIAYSSEGQRIIKDSLTDKEMKVDFDKVEKCEECEEYHPVENWSKWRKSEKDKEQILCKWCIVEKKFAESLA